jgi:hypothetical protein
MAPDVCNVTQRDATFATERDLIRRTQRHATQSQHPLRLQRNVTSYDARNVTQRSHSIRCHLLCTSRMGFAPGGVLPSCCILLKCPVTASVATFRGQWRARTCSVRLSFGFSSGFSSGSASTCCHLEVDGVLGLVVVAAALGLVRH